MKSKIIKDFIKDKTKNQIAEILKNPQELKALPAKMAALVDSGVNDIMTIPQRIEEKREERFKAVLKIMYLLHTSKGNISAEM